MAKSRQSKQPRWEDNEYGAVAEQDAIERTRWLQEVDDGSLLLLKPGPMERMSDVAKMVLGLNDVCCERGIGRVYLLVTHKAWAEYPREIRADMQRLPEVVFLPEAWTRTEQKEWKTKGWRWQFFRICARHGWLPDHVPVLPIRVHIHAKKPQRPQFDALAQASVLVYCTPTPYVALIAEIEAMTTLTSATTERVNWYREIKGNNSTSGWDRIEHWKMAGPEALVDRLEYYYWEGATSDSQLTTFYGSLMTSLAEFNTEGGELADSSEFETESEVVE